MFVFVCGMACASEKQMDTKCTFVCTDKSETLLERCHACVYPWGVCVCVFG